MITVDALKTAISQRCQDYLSEYPLANRPSFGLPLLLAQNFVLAQDITAAFDVPRQNLSAMDGFALSLHSELTENSVFDVVGESCAGSPFTGTLTAGQAVRIFTGAVVPSDCDTVVMQENTDFDKHIFDKSTDKSKTYQITLTKTANHNSNIRSQGEEIHTGETVLTAGKRLNPTDISLLASLGVASVMVTKPLVVGILATGDELVSLGEPLTHLAQIYNSNTPTLRTLLQGLPIIIKDYGIVPDDLTQTKQTVQQAISDCDVLISTAGVSVGDYDFLTQVVDELGKINHYKVAMKPGKPFVFGEFEHDDKTVLYFGLPGNPLSTVVGCLQFVRPAIWQLTGVDADDLPKPLRLSAICQTDIRKKSGRQEFQRAYFEQTPSGELVVTPFNHQDSHRVKQLSQANCLLVLTVERGDVAQGEMVEIQPFEWCFG